MRLPNSQRGLLLVVAVVIIAVAATMAVVIVTLTAGSGSAGGQHLQSTQALFVAEAGLEKAKRERTLNNAYTGEGPTSFGPGSFTVSVFTTDILGNPLPAGQQRIRSTGQVGSTSRTIETVVRLAGAMIVYAKEAPGASVGVPFYRRWNSNTSTWSAEAQANDVGPNIQYMVLKFARTRDEAILGTMNSSGEIHVQVWNGNTATWGPPMLLADTGGAGDADFRSFDIEYESSSDRAIVVYKDANGSDEPDYRIWDGTSWSSATNITLPTTGEVRWVELAAHPTSDEIVMITLDSNGDVKGMRWPGGGGAGTPWSDMGVAGTWDTAAADSGAPAMNPSKVIDVAYEQLSGRAMFIWGNDDNNLGDGDLANPDEQRYRIWDSVTLTLSAPATLTISAMADVADWVRLVPRPASNELMYGVQDGGRDLNTALWNGAGWTVHGEHDTDTEDEDHRNFDIVFETHPNNAGQAWLVWGSEPPGGGANNGLARTRRWTGSAWDPSAGVAGSDDTALIQLAAHVASGAIFSGIYDDTNGSAADDIREMHQANGVQAWSAIGTIWNGGTAADPVMERVFIAPERFVPTISWREVFP